MPSTADRLTPGGSRRRALGPGARARRSARATAALLALAVAATLAVFEVSGGEVLDTLHAATEPSGPSAVSRAPVSRASAVPDPGPGSTPPAATSRPTGPAYTSARVIRAPHIKVHIPTVAELQARFAQQGLYLLDGDPTKPTSFQVASFNVLGNSHTDPGGWAASWPSGLARLPAAIGFLRAHDVSVVGLQEFQAVQHREMLRSAGEYAIFPGPEEDNNIAWRTADWELVESHTHTIPYFGGHPRNMPYVLLRNKATGREVWFSNYHNPADVSANEAGNRGRSVAIEADLARRLTAGGTPMIVLGDMNDRRPFICDFTGRLPSFHASDGSRNAGGCSTPRFLNVDWVVGSGNVSFSNHAYDNSLKARKVTDHGVTRALATIAPAIENDKCRRYVRLGRTLWFCPDPSAG